MPPKPTGLPPKPAAVPHGNSPLADGEGGWSDDDQDEQDREIKVPVGKRASRGAAAATAVAMSEAAVAAAESSGEPFARAPIVSQLGAAKPLSALRGAISPAARVMVEVPEGARGGTPLHIQTAQAVVRVVLPVGYTAGSLLQVQLPVGATPPPGTRVEEAEAGKPQRPKSPSGTPRGDAMYSAPSMAEMTAEQVQHMSMQHQHQMRQVQQLEQYSQQLETYNENLELAVEQAREQLAAMEAAAEEQASLLQGLQATSERDQAENGRLRETLAALQRTMDEDTATTRQTVETLKAAAKKEVQQAAERAVAQASRDSGEWAERAAAAERGLEELQRQTAERLNGMQQELARLLGRNHPAAATLASSLVAPIAAAPEATDAKAKHRRPSTPTSGSQQLAPQQMAPYQPPASVPYGVVTIDGQRLSDGLSDGREGALHPEYARLQGQMQMLEDGILRLLEPSQASELQAILSSIESRYASGARTRTPSAGGTRASSGGRKSVPQSDLAAPVFERDAERLGEIVEALLALQGYPGMLGHGRAKLSRPSSRGGTSEGWQATSRPSSRQGAGRHPALQTTPADNSVRAERE